jgi:DNA replication and repair protein RecF
MALAFFRVEQFRCLSRAELSFDARANIISGNNASGKTSLLEAIFFLCRGRSFRQSRTDRLVQHGSQDFQLFGRLQAGELRHAIGVRAGRGDTEIRLDGRSLSGFSEIVERTAIQVIEPEIHTLIAEGPDKRRRFLDYGVFHVEPGYLPAWRRYHKVLKQRNAALRSKAPNSEIAAWDEAFIDNAATIDSYRTGYTRMLSDPIRETSEQLGLAEIEIEYRPGWEGEKTIEVALAHSLERDRQLGITHVGPHRADLKILYRKRAARQQVSRGQQKLLASSLVIAQSRILNDLKPGASILLLDDPAAELDRHSLTRLLAVVGELPCQLIVTALEPSAITLHGEPARFHVEHGSVAPLA